MKKFTSLMAAMLLGGAAFSTNAAYSDITPTLFNYPAGVSTVYSVTVIWDYELLYQNDDPMTVYLIEYDNNDVMRDIIVKLDDTAYPEDGSVPVPPEGEYAYDAILVNFSNNGGALTAGRYGLWIPDSIVCIGQEEGNENAEYTLDFTVGDVNDNPTPDVSYMEEGTADPANIFQSFLPDVTVTWDNGAEISFADGSESGTVQVSLDGGFEFEDVNAVIRTVTLSNEQNGGTDTWDAYQLYIDLFDVIPFGEYGIEVAILVPEGLVMNADGDVNPGEFFVYYILETNSNYTLNPGDNSELTIGNAIVELSWEGCEIQLLEENGIYVRNSKGEDTYLEFFEDVNFNSDYTALLFDLNGFEAGSYELIVPQGVLALIDSDDEYINGEVFANYTLVDDFSNGVSTIEAANGEQVIYNLQGIRIDRMDKGIYIVNGKKVIVK